MTKVAITGHRPDKLKKTYGEYFVALRLAYAEVGALYVYEGQAAGIDLIAARAAFESEIPYAAVIPWKGHRDSLPVDWRNDWDQGVRYADYVEELSDSTEFPGNWVYFNRNQYMVDHADVVIAVWNGEEGSGGTWHTVNYARSLGRPIWVLNPNTLYFGEDNGKSKTA